MEEKIVSENKEIYELENGTKYFITQIINSNWSEYDKTVATCHLTNYDKIYCDIEYLTPIDNEYEISLILQKEGQAYSYDVNDLDEELEM